MRTQPILCFVGFLAFSVECLLIVKASFKCRYYSMKKHIIDEFGEAPAARPEMEAGRLAVAAGCSERAPNLLGDEYVVTLQSFERQELDRELLL